MFVAPMDAEGEADLRASYEMVAVTGRRTTTRSPAVLMNDAILVMDNVLIPWENVLIYRDFDRCRAHGRRFCPAYPLQACASGGEASTSSPPHENRWSVPAPSSAACRSGEVVARRNMFWALSDSMCSKPRRG